MEMLVRWMLCLAWMAGVGWLWQAGTLGTTAALLLAAPGLWLLRTPRRRRGGGLQYVQMAKAPVAFP